MLSADAAYSSAREELIARVGARDTALLAYVTGTGAYFAFWLTLPQPSAIPNWSLAVPVYAFSLALASVVGQHHLVIGLLGDYLRHQFPPADDGRFRHWDNSLELIAYARTSFSIRHWTHLAVFTLPCLYGARFMYEQQKTMGWPFFVGLAGLVTAVAIYWGLTHLNAVRNSKIHAHSQ